MINRKILQNVGNTNGRDISCSNCHEPYENCYILDDFTDEELNDYVVLRAQLDDHGGKKTRIAALNGCPACEGVPCEEVEEEEA